MFANLGHFSSLSIKVIYNKLDANASSKYINCLNTNVEIHGMKFS